MSLTPQLKLLTSSLGSKIFGGDKCLAVILLALIETFYYNGQFLKVFFTRLSRSTSFFDGFRFISFSTVAHCSAFNAGIGFGSTLLTIKLCSNISEH